MTVEEAARALEVSCRTIRNWCHSGQLVWQRRGPQIIRVSVASVRAMLGEDSAKALDRNVAAKMAGRA